MLSPVNKSRTIEVLSCMPNLSWAGCRQHVVVSKSQGSVAHSDPQCRPILCFSTYSRQTMLPYEKYRGLRQLIGLGGQAVERFDDAGDAHVTVSARGSSQAGHRR